MDVPIKFDFNSSSVFLASLILAAGFSLQTVAQEKTALQMDRTAKMKTLGRSMYHLKSAADVATMKTSAVAIATTAQKLVNMWPKGSGGSATRAKTNIWTEMEEFKARFLAMQNALDKLLSATDGTNLRAAKTAFSEVGGTCKACHKVYRGPKK